MGGEARSYCSGRRPPPSNPKVKILTAAGTLALLAGMALSIAFALSCIRRGIRESGSLRQERLEGPMRSAFTPAASDAVGNCERLLEKGEYSGVLVDAEIALAEPGLRPNERAALLLLRADALIAVRADVEPALREILRLPCGLFHKMDVYALGCILPALLAVGLLVPILIMATEVPGLDACRELGGWPSPLWRLTGNDDSEERFLRYWCAFPAWFFGFALVLGAFVLSGLTYLGSVLGRDPTRPPAPRTKCRAPGP